MFPNGTFEHFFPLCVTCDGVICSMKTIKKLAMSNIHVNLGLFNYPHANFDSSHLFFFQKAAASFRWGNLGGYFFNLVQKV